MQLKQTDEQLDKNLNDGFDNKNDDRDGFEGYEELRNDDFMNQFEEQPYVSSMPEPAKKSFKEKASISFILFMFVFVTGWCLLSGVKGLLFANTHSMEDAFTNIAKGDVYEGGISYISPEFCELKHTINLIPAGTEHFYLMFSADGKHVVPIRASKKWDKQFIGNSVQTVSLQERGIAREMDYKVRDELSSIVTAFQAEGIQVESSLYIDLIADRLCILQIITGISLIVCVIYFTVIVKKGVEDSLKSSFSNLTALFMMALFVVTFGMLIYLLNMVGF